MKYKKYFETSLYRECNKIRTEANMSIVESKIKTLVSDVFLTGILDMLLVAVICKNIDILWLSIIICVLIGLISGVILAKLTKYTIIPIRKALMNYKYDIEILTDKIEDMQDADEDYEFVGDKDE